MEGNEENGVRESRLKTFYMNFAANKKKIRTSVYARETVI